MGWGCYETNSTLNRKTTKNWYNGQILPSFPAWGAEGRMLQSLLALADEDSDRWRMGWFLEHTLLNCSVQKRPGWNCWIKWIWLQIECHVWMEGNIVCFWWQRSASSSGFHPFMLHSNTEATNIALRRSVQMHLKHIIMKLKSLIPPSCKTANYCYFCLRAMWENKPR